MLVTRQPSPTGLLLGHMDSPSFTQGIQPLVLKPHLCIKAPHSLLGSAVHTLLIQKPFPPGCCMPGPSLSTGTPVNARPYTQGAYILVGQKCGSLRTNKGQLQTQEERLLAPSQIKGEKKKMWAKRCDAIYSEWHEGWIFSTTTWEPHATTPNCCPRCCQREMKATWTTARFLAQADLTVSTCKCLEGEMKRTNIQRLGSLSSLWNLLSKQGKEITTEDPKFCHLSTLLVSVFKLTQEKR